MLDNLRAMAVFASVVDHGSFSGAGKELGITTSAVSQQIRALEVDLGVVLLHRSTRKLSLTEAGASLYDSARAMVKFANEARENIGQLRDGLLGSLRIATTPSLAKNHILPALSTWLNKHNDLLLRLVTSNEPVDMIDGQIDVSIYFATENKDIGVPLIKTRQILVASGEYLYKNPITNIQTLQDRHFIGLGENEPLILSRGGEKEVLKPTTRLVTNDNELALDLAMDGHGIVAINEFDVKKHLQENKLIQVLPEYKMPQLVLYGKTLSKEQQPAKVWRCLEVLTEYFSDK